MTTPTEAKVRSIAGRASSLYPIWTSQPVVDGSAGSFDQGAFPTDGISVENSMYALIRFQLRADARYRSMVVEIDTAVAADYSVEVFGTTYTFTSTGTDKLAILNGLKGQIDGGSDPVTSEVDSSALTLTIKGDYTQTNNRTGAINTPGVSSTGGAISMVVEASAVTWSLITKAKNLPSGGDALAVYQFSDGTHSKSFADYNYEERIQVAGLEEIYLQVTDTDGTVTPMIGACADSD